MTDRTSITVQIDHRKYPQPPVLGVLGVVRGMTDLVAQIELHEPISVAGMANACKRVITLWFEPELGADSNDQLANYLDSLGDRLL